MSKGEHFERYFTSHGYAFEPNDRGEATVLCPFPHAKGFENNPSAHINVNKGIFHCKTCAAEGRFSKGGMSEIQFVAKVNGITYAQALRYMTQFEEKELASENWEEAMINLQGNAEYMTFLEGRGLTRETVKQYRLGSTGDGIIYPVFVEDFLLDKRTYNIHYKEEGTPKIRSSKHGTVLLFPFDAWKQDTRPTLFCAGENDTLLARQHGFNALTLTGGEGASIPKVFLSRFRDKEVYVCYDCDSPGKIGARRIAFQLREVGANVKIVDLGLSGEPDDKDLSDFILKYNHTSDDLFQKLEEAKEYDDNEFQEAKDEEYPLVDLWQIAHAQYHNKYVSSRVLMQGEFGDGSLVMQAPSAIEWVCEEPNLDDAGKSPCWDCPLKHQSGTWFLEDYNIGKVLELVEVTKKEQDRTVKEVLNLPAKCPGARITVKDWSHVRKVVFTPDVESEGEWTNFREAEVWAYTVGLDLKDGQRYRVYYRSYAHPIDDQRTVMVVDRAEDSDNSINSFRMTPEIKKELEMFQGDPFVKMEERYEHIKQVVGKFSPRSVALATDLTYHSVLDYKFNGREMKGHPEVLVIGPPRVGKSKTIKLMQRFYGMGNSTDLKLASLAGLVGGADRNSKGQYRTKWGIIPKNHKGFVFLDEMSGLGEGIINQLTAVRSERIAKIEKVSGSGRAPAKVRIMWASNTKPNKVGNHRETKPISMYPSGVEIVKELIGAEEDISRFDLIIILPDMKVADWISPLEQDEYEQKDSTPFRNLIYWAWSRTADQVTFEPGVERYIVQLTEELIEKYAFLTSGLFTTETDQKLTRFAISVATCCFSCDESGENVVVKKEHVDWAKKFIIENYDNRTFRLNQHVEKEKQYYETNPQINNKVAQLCRSQELLMQTLSSMQTYHLQELKLVVGMDQDQFSDAIADLAKHCLIRTHSGILTPTMRLSKALEYYRDEHEKYRMVPLTEGGSRI